MLDINKAKLKPKIVLQPVGTGTYQSKFMLILNKSPNSI